MMMTRFSRGRRLGVVASTVLAASLTLVGCGAGDSSSGSSASSGKSQVDTAGLKTAVEAVAEFSKPVTTPTTDQTLTERPPAGKTVVFIQCAATPACKLVGGGVKEAAKVLGWDFKLIAYDAADPTAFTSAMNTALRYKPVAVLFTGQPYTAYQTLVPAFEKAGVLIAPISTPDAPPSSTVLPVTSGPGASVKSATLLTNWFIADSKGTGHALIANVPEYSQYKAFTDTSKALVQKQCPACEITVLDMTKAQFKAQEGPQAVTTALRKDKSIGYVLGSFSGFIAGTDNAIVTAGLKGKVKVASAIFDPTVLQGMKTGTQFATTGQSPALMGWAAVDSLLRTMQHLDIPEGNAQGLAQLYTLDNMGSLSADASEWTPDFDVAKAYAALWKVA